MQWIKDMANVTAAAQVAGVAWVQTQVRELPYAMGVAKKKRTLQNLFLNVKI